MRVKKISLLLRIRAEIISHAIIFFLISLLAKKISKGVIIFISIDFIIELGFFLLNFISNLYCGSAISLPSLTTGSNYCN